MSTIPGSPPPSQTYLEEDCSRQLVAAVACMLTLSSLFLGLRLYARVLTTAGRGWDDFLLPGAWILIVGASAINILMVARSGAGRHVEYVEMKDPEALNLRGKLVFAQSYLAVVSNTLSRLSIAALYLRLFPKGLAKTISWVMVFYFIAFVLAQMITGPLECTPLSFLWDPEMEGAQCINLFLYFELSGILNIVGDVALMIIPVPIIWKLQTSTSRKAGIAIAFLSGSLGLIASCIRTGIFFSGDRAWVVDPTWEDATLASWTLVESGMYAISACLIGLRPVVVSTSEWLKDSMSSTQSRLLSSRRKTTMSPENGSQESVSNITSGFEGKRFRMRPLGRDLEGGHDGHVGSKDIRVQSDINVMSAEVNG